MSTHRIALKGPWGFTWTSFSTGCQSRGTATMPVEYTQLHGYEAGEVAYSRKFHYPKISAKSLSLNDLPGLRERHSVFVEFSGMRGCGRVEFNSQILGTFDTGTEFHSFLLPRPQQNFSELLVLISVNEQLVGQKHPAGLYGTVFLRIDESSAESC